MTLSANHRRFVSILPMLFSGPVGDSAPEKESKGLSNSKGWLKERARYGVLTPKELNSCNQGRKKTFNRGGNLPEADRLARSCRSLQQSGIQAERYYTSLCKAFALCISDGFHAHQHTHACTHTLPFKSTTFKVIGTQISKSSVQSSVHKSKNL